MFSVEIADCCKKLRLSRNLADMAQITDGESHQEYLYKLLAAELKNREQRRTDKLLNSAGFYSIKTFDDIRFDEITLPSGLMLESLKSLNFIKEKKNIIMYGRTGTGKTLLSTALGVAACQNNIPVRFYRTAALVNQLSEAKKSGILGTIIKKMNKASVIILDEWGYVPYDRTGAQLLFDYLSEIHEQKSIVLNTNLEFSRWVNVLYDEQMTAALVGRLMHHCLRLSRKK
jgi:DNA replication protein DnaC